MTDIVYLQEDHKGSLTHIESDQVDISIFIPCYNEENNVVGAIEKVVAAANSCNVTYEILVFDDNSDDRTVEIVEKLMRDRPDCPLRLFVNEINRGVSRNFFEGAFYARGRHYRLICGDDVEPIQTHEALFNRMGEADIIVPYFIQIGGRTAFRHVLSWTFTRLVNFMSGFKLHYYNGCPIYKRWDILRFHVEATGLGYQAELLTRLLNEQRTFVEVPLKAIDREGSVSLKFRSFISVGHSLLKIALRRLSLYHSK
jgi:glycosyltransferase involved in cell wall biosynthesis